MSARRPISVDSDRTLVEGVLSRAPGAFEKLIECYQGLCWHIVNRMVREPDDTRDLCQETFLRVYQRLHQFRFESPLKSWIGQIAYSIALRHLERKRVSLFQSVDDENDREMIESVSDGFDLEAASGDEQLCALLREEIESLAPVPRTVLMLHHLEELPVDEIAGITGLAIGTVKSHLFRSRAALRKRIETRLGVAI